MSEIQVADLFCGTSKSNEVQVVQEHKSPDELKRGMLGIIPKYYPLLCYLLNVPHHFFSQCDVNPKPDLLHKTYIFFQCQGIYGRTDLILCLNPYELARILFEHQDYYDEIPFEIFELLYENKFLNNIVCSFVSPSHRTHYHKSYIFVVYQLGSLPYAMNVFYKNSNKISDVQYKFQNVLCNKDISSLSSLSTSLYPNERYCLIMFFYRRIYQ